MFASSLTVSIILILGAFIGPSDTSAQNLNNRKAAPPGAKAKIGRVLSKARSDAAESGQELNKDTVNTDCSPVEVGTQAPPENGRLSRNEQIVVVPGDIINICR